MKLHLYKNTNSIVLHRWNYIKDYQSFIESNKENEILTLDNANFRFQNNVYTEFIFNMPNYVNLKPGTIFTYMIVENGDNFSSWYVANTYLIRGGQYNLKLKRDLLNDYLKYIKGNDFNVARSFFNNQMKLDKNILPHLINEDKSYLTNINDNLKEREILDLSNISSNLINGTWSPFNLTMDYKGGNSVYIQSDNTHGAFLIYFDDNITSISFDVDGDNDRYPFINVSNVNENIYGTDLNGESFIVGSQKEYDKGYTCWKCENNSEKSFTNMIPFSMRLNKLKSTIGYVLAIPRFFGKDSRHVEDHYQQIIGLKERFGEHVIDIQYVPYFFTCQRYKILYYWGYEVERKKDGSENLKSLVPFFEVNTFDTRDGLFINNNYFNTEFNKGLIEKKVIFHQTRCEFTSPSQLYKVDFNYFKACGLNGSYPSIYLYHKMQPYQMYFGISFSSTCYYNLYNLNDKDLFYIPTEDFTLDLNTSEFQNYQLSNKNYANIFNRQISSSDTDFWLGYGKGITTGIGNTVGNLFTTNPGKAISSSVQTVSNAIFDPISYYNSRNANIDIYNMQIENIKSRPDTPLVKGNFTPQNLGGFAVNFYSNDENTIEEYKSILKNKGIMFNFNNIKLNYMFKKLQLSTTINNDGIKPYLECEMISNNNDNTNYFDNYLWNEINKELASGVYLTEDSFQELIKEN